MSQDKPKKTRVQFDFASEALDRLDRLVKLTEVTSRADVVRNSLRLYEWLVDRAGEGKYMILVEDAGRDGAIDLRLITGALPSTSSQGPRVLAPVRRR